MPEGQDGTTHGQQPQGAPAAGRAAQQPTRKVDRRIEELAREYGSKHAALKHLTTRLLNLEEETDALRAKLPHDGAVVLTGDDAAAWAAYQALGTPKALEATATKVAELEKKEANRTRAERHRTLAGQAGVNADALAALAAAQGFDVAEVKEIDAGNGQTIKAVMVRPAGDEKAEAKPLADYAAAQGFGALLPALTAVGGSGTTTTTTAHQAPAGIPFGTQAGAGAGTGASRTVATYAAIRKEEEDRVAAQRKQAGAGTGAERLGLVRRSA